MIANCILSVFGCNSQNTYNGKILSNKTKAPLTYVNIGIIGRDVGTVSNQFGEYKIPLDDTFDRDSIRFSIIGYKATTLSVSDFKQEYRSNRDIYLVETPIMLKEAIIYGRELQTKILGNHSPSKRINAGFNSNDLGSELGVIIKIEKSPTYIDYLNFTILKNIYDSLLFRLNIYSLKDGKPDKNILDKNIFLKTKKKEGSLRLNLKKYNIVVENDFLISLEWLQNLGNQDEMGLTFPGSFLSVTTYSRKTSPGAWQKVPYVGLGFSTTVRH